MLSIEKSASARSRIADTVILQCESGSQNHGLSDDVKACGQYLEVPQWKQRGRLGTAAAIRILARDARDSARDLVPKLVRYLSAPAAFDAGKPADDAVNVIKLSESLYSLHFVGAAVAGTEGVRQQLASVLKGAPTAGTGWRYYADEDGQPDVLPTAHAVQALQSDGHDCDGAVQFLLKAITSNGESSTSGAQVDISVRVFALYVLTFGKNGSPLVPKATLQKAFKPLWGQLYSLLRDYDVEQNIAYERPGQNHYVRVPWQLLLIALASKLSPLRAFASLSAQGRLASVMRAVESPKGFVYPHSGDKVSTRTYAILYDVLATIERELPAVGRTLVPGAVLDWVVNSRATTLLARYGALFVLGLSLLDFLLGQDTKWASLAPEFLGAFLLLLLSARKTR